MKQRSEIPRINRVGLNGTVIGNPNDLRSSMCDMLGDGDLLDRMEAQTDYDRSPRESEDFLNLFNNTLNLNATTHALIKATDLPAINEGDMDEEVKDEARVEK